MHLSCPKCAAVLDFSRRRPSFCAECGTPLPPELTEVTPPDPNATTAETSRHDIAGTPERVGGYRLLRRLGAGGMGSVWEAEDDTGRRVAVKLIAPEVAASPEAVARFRREGRLASGLSHPRCVFVLAAEEDQGRPYLVMELMPGDSLKDEVERRGPLPINEAVPHILDVMEGLSEAHQRGIVHRDVKPSNCFLDSDGRVKIGDFGLSKSLTADADVSRSGTFLGTPLFASPEQIRRDDVDARSDVWSTAATLYYLLAGRAPFQGGDAAAVMARILADPPPPLRRFRPEVPRGLEQVILRGLERDPARRWQSTDEFRAALTLFVPGRLSMAGLGMRLGAFFVDVTILVSLQLLGPELSADSLGEGGLAWTAMISTQFLLLAFDGPLWALYFFTSEALWGCTPGKWLVGLRVCPLDAPGAPRARQVLVRALVYSALTCLPMDALTLAMMWVLVVGGIDPWTIGVVGPVLIGVWLCCLLGLSVLMLPMRAANGYRGLHEFLSGTRTVLLPSIPRPRPTVTATTAPASADVPARLGAFEVRGALAGDDGDRLLLGVDPVLGRAVALRLRPASAGPLSLARRTLARPTRLRWLAGEEAAGQCWDAFAAPQGAPLASRVTPAAPLSWPETRSVLTQLAEELSAAEEDGTRPATLDPGQVYWQPSGRIQMLDVSPNSPGAGPDALAFLGRVAVLALEGRPRADGAGPVRAPLPLHAAAVVDRLVGTGPPYATVAEFRAELEATQSRPAAMTAALRAGHLGYLLLLTFPGLVFAAWAVVMFSALAFGFASAIHSAYEHNLKLLAAQEEDVEQQLRRLVAPDPELEARRAMLAAARDVHERWVAKARVEGRHRRQALSIWFLGDEEWIDPEEALREYATRGRTTYFPMQPPPHVTALGWLIVACVASIAFWPAVWVLWTFLLRGGLSYRLAGLMPVRYDGARAGRLRLAWRALLMWGPMATLLAVAVLVEAFHPEWVGLPQGLFVLAWLVLLGLAVSGLRDPTRGLHDRLSGVTLVPR